jgi:hypothetical protein
MHFRFLPFLFSAAAFMNGARAEEIRVPLFTIGKNTNANEVHYEARLKDGHLDPKQPVICYWIMSAEDGRRQELNILERTKAYGFNIRPEADPETFRLIVVSDKKKEIRVFREGNSVRAVANIGGHRAYLQRIFINTHKAFMLSLPDYAEMFGIDVETGEPRYEKVLPSDR